MINGGERDALRLGRALLAAGAARPQDWKGDIDEFLGRTLQWWVDVGSGALPRHPGLVLAATRGPTDILWYDYTDGAECERVRHPECFYVVLTCGFGDHESLTLGRAIRLLASEDPRLSSTLYDVLYRSVGFTGTFGWQDCEWIAEGSYEIHCEETGEEYDDAAADTWIHRYVPESVLTKPYTSDQLRDRIPHIENAASRILMTAVLELAACARTLPRLGDWSKQLRAEIALVEWSEPLPAYYLGFDENDDVWGFFDYDFQIRQQVGEAPAPLAMIQVDITAPKSIHAAQKWVQCAARVIGHAQRVIQRLPVSDDPRALVNTLAEDMPAAAGDAVAQVLVSV